MKKLYFALGCIVVFSCLICPFVSANINDYNGSLVLLLHTNQSPSNPTYFNDSSSINHVGSTYGNAITNTTIKYLGNASMYLDGNDGVGTSYVAFPDSADWNFGSTPWTIHSVAMFNASSRNYTSLWGQTTDSNNRSSLYISGGTLYFAIVSSGSITALYSKSSPGLGVGTWYAFDVVWDGSNLKLYNNGVDQSWTVTTAYTSTPDFTGTFKIAGDPAALAYYHAGYIDEMAVWKGAAIPIADLGTMQYEMGVLPVAYYSKNASSGSSPLPVQFTDLSQNYPQTWKWSITNSSTTGGNGTEILISTLQNPSYTFYTGNWSINLTAINYMGDSKNTTGWVNVSPPSPPAPIAIFSGSPTTGTVPLNVTFTDSSVSGITDWSWAFDDGNVSTLQNPEYRYLGAGTYSVALTVTNASGSNTTTKTNYITVNPMVASFSANVTSGINPVPVKFTGSSTGVADAWYWEFGDGNTSVEQSPTFVYGVNGTFNVNMRATNITSGAFDWENKTGYITIYGTPDGFNQQDIELDPQFLLTIHFTDSSTGAAIPVVTVTTSDGQTYTTTNGTAYFTEPYSTVVVYASATGYAGISRSYIMDSDRDETIQMTAVTVTTQSANAIWQPTSVAIQILDANRNPIIGDPVYINAYSSSLPGGLTGAVTYFKNAYGVPESVAQSMLAANTTYYGTTDDNGFISAQVVSIIQYQIVTHDTNGINVTTLMWPAGPYYQIVTANATVAGIAAQGRAQMSINQNSTFNTTYWQPNSSYSCMGVHVYDSTGQTSDVYAWWKYVENGTVWWENSTAIGGYGPVNSTKCVLHIPYQQWKWGGITD